MPNFFNAPMTVSMSCASDAVPLTAMLSVSCAENSWTRALENKVALPRLSCKGESHTRRLLLLPGICIKDSRFRKKFLVKLRFDRTADHMYSAFVGVMKFVSFSPSLSRDLHLNHVTVTLVSPTI